MAAIVGVLLSHCAAAPPSTAPVVRIGLVAPFEGRQREIGYDVIYSARLAVREWNGRGGVAGYRVELVALDDSGDPEMAIRAAQTLAIDPAVVGVVGHWLATTTEAARPVYDQAGLALIASGENWVSDPRPSLPTATSRSPRLTSRQGPLPGRPTKRATR